MITHSSGPHAKGYSPGLCIDLERWEAVLFFSFSDAESSSKTRSLLAEESNSPSANDDLTRPTKEMWKNYP
jgi:hypothetical protein